MSTHSVEVFKLGTLTEHPNADSLLLTTAFAYPVITRKGGFKEGDLVAYIPVDSVVPDTEEWNYLAPAQPDGSMTPVGDVDEKYRRIKAKKLRGVFSMGLLHPAPAGAAVGDNVAEILGITKYVPPESLVQGGEDDPDHPLVPKYTEIEHYLRYSHKLVPGEEVLAFEKLHGANSRIKSEVTATGGLVVGSHGKIKKYDPSNQWWAAAIKMDLSSKLAKYPDYVFYGELLGTQDLKYGLQKGTQTLRFFDILNSKSRTYLDWEDAVKIFAELDLPTVTPVYEGPLPSLEELRKITEAESPEAVRASGGKSTGQICEGIVIRPKHERQDLEFEIGRVILKLISERYLTRKGGTEAK